MWELPRTWFLDGNVALHIGEVLGSGASATVCKAKLSSTGEVVAVKEVRAADTEKCEQLLQDIRALTSVPCHPNLLGFKAALFCKDSGKLALVLEFMDLGQLAGRIPLKTLAIYSRQILSGLDFLHSLRILHRDIKPPNLLHNSQGQVKIADFGIAKWLQQQEDYADTMVGTKLYMAPERFFGNYSFAADVWAMGVSIHELAQGVNAFASCKSDNEFWSAVEHGSVPPVSMAPELNNFVSRCLAQEPEARATADELLQHAFVSGVASCVC